MPAPITLPRPEELEEGTILTEDQKAAVNAEKEEIWDSPEVGEDPLKETKPPTKEPEKTPEVPEKEDATDKTDDETEEEEAKAAEEKAAQEAEAKETARLEKKAKELDKTVDETKEVEAQEKAEQERLETLAKEGEMTVEEVKGMEEKDSVLAERHGNDPKKIARALRMEQSEYGKIKNEVEELREYKVQVEESIEKNFMVNLEAKMERDKEDIIDQFERQFPKEAEGMNEDAMFERAKGIIKSNVEKKKDEETKEITKKAEARRTEILKSVSDEYKEFLPEIKSMLDTCSDSHVCKDKEFDIGIFANYARGKKHTPEYVKNLEDIAYKRGVEQPKMIPKVKGGKSKVGKKDSDLIMSLSETEKSRAEDIYGRREGWSKERMYEEFAKHDKGNDF